MKDHWQGIRNAPLPAFGFNAPFRFCMQNSIEESFLLFYLLLFIFHGSSFIITKKCSISFVFVNFVVNLHVNQCFSI